jgi:hypothetical protein
MMVTTTKGAIVGEDDDDKDDAPVLLSQGVEAARRARVLEEPHGEGGPGSRVPQAHGEEQEQGEGPQQAQFLLNHMQ